MQGAWLAATAVGNSLLFIGGLLYTFCPAMGMLDGICNCMRLSMIVYAFNG
jgi:POT family proton-dependent oligopeptide transporter